MAFTKIAKSTMGSGHPARYEIRMGSRHQSKTVKTRSVYFAFARTVVEEVGWEITTPPLRRGELPRISVHVAVHEGTGEDAGFLLLAEDKDKGYAFGTSKGTVDAASGISFAGSVSVSRFSHYVINDPVLEHEPEAVEFTVDEKEHTILIQCPDWLRYNSLSVPPPVKEVVAPVAPTPFHTEEGKGQTQTRRVVKVRENPDPDADEVIVEGKREKMNRQERRLLAKKVADAMR